jgi:ribose 1,5-bisphosphokinase
MAQGTFVAVAGPSGAGKDSLIRHARQVLADDSDISFVRRVVTRQADPDAEDHDTLSPQQFEAAEAAGAFAVTWRAHGLAYGIPAETIDHVRNGGIAVANCSRGALAHVRDSFPGLLIVHVTAAPEVLARRIAARGRETVEEAGKRVARSVEAFDHIADVVTIENNGELDAACAEFVKVLQRLRRV